ncbi:MAG TPA: pyridine nucleotide-disulfide oxidoreductase [Clostridiaceae bacterium]|nr:pyridine nucleotide-disulfide oxidoreductase [Clostridiaceae bacterium]
MGKKVLIVGGVAGGASAAARLRRLDENAEIIMFERDGYISFANCGLPYHIGEVIKEREKLLVQTPEAMNKRFNIDVRINSEVTSIDAKNKRVMVKSADRGLYEESYDYIILSPGAKPIRPNIPGINSSRIFSLRNIPDTDRIKDYVDNKNIRSAIVIGGGFIGVEMAENLVERSIKVTLVEAAPHILAPFDSDMVVIAEKEMEQKGIKLILGDGVKAFSEENSSVQVTLNSDNTLSADMIILAIGVTPDTGFLKDSGIELGPKGHIIVNDRMETNIEGIYAVGDAIEVVDFVTGQKTAIPLAGPANKQGRVAADNAAGLNSVYKGSQGTSILKIFNLTAASTGANERTLQRLNIPYSTIFLHPNSHAGYYPDALPMTIKLIFNDEGKVLGSQIIGYDGVDKRIDVIAAVIRLKGTVNDLAELELAYAPPYSSAKDPVNMAGFMAQNILNDMTSVITPSQFKAMDKDDYILLDVRTEEEFENGHVDGAVNIPVDSLRDRLHELDKEKAIIEYCQVGLRGYIASRILKQNGFKAVNITGGYKSFFTEKFEPGKSAAVNDRGEAVKSFSQGQPDRELDACGLCCPGPLMQVKSCIEELNKGQVLKVTATDPGFYEDIKAWTKRTNNELMNVQKDGGKIVAHIKKGMEVAPALNSTTASIPVKDNKTIVVFSGDLDKAIASFIIANGAASMGKKVTMFFTFWGLNILRKHDKVSVQKGFMDNMFGMMMPRGSKRLGLSKMNMLGMGPKMIRSVMKSKNVTSLEDLIKAAMESGIEIVACQMSMDVMGLKQEELIDGVKIGGVGYYLGEAEDSNVNLFI